MRRFLCVLLIILFLLFRPAKCLAVDFKSDYKVDYYLEESDNKVRTKVKFTIDITNLRSDVYVKKVTLSFPNDFAIKNLSASDNTGVVIPQVEYNTDNIDLQLEFNNPNVGRESINTFYLNFEQDNLVQKNGYIWEIILPTINKETRNQYKVTLHIPELSSKKISLSKPRPDEISATEVIWNNPTAKTIYITLGDRQFYHAQLGYHLKNDQLVPIYTDVAFPPDTLYQKTYVKFIHPKPAYVYMDADGNYLGRYLLNPRQTLDITYDGFIESFINPREEVMSFERNQIELQKKYLFNFDKNWDLKDKKPTFQSQKHKINRIS